MPPKEGGFSIMVNNNNQEPKGSRILLPSAFTLSRNSWTPHQYKYILRVMANIQTEIKAMISQKAMHRQVDPTVFQHIDNYAWLEIPFRNLEPSESHYPNLEKDLAEISKKNLDVPYKIPVPRNPNKVQVAWQRLPYIFYYQRSLKKNRKRYARITIPFEVIQYLFAMDFGYHRIDLDLMFSLPHYAARKLYDLMEGSLKINVREFEPRMVFGLLTCDSTYAGFGNLEYHQLSVAEHEIKRAFDLGLSDCYVTHTRKDIINKFVENTIKVVFELHQRGESPGGSSTQVVSKELAGARARLKMRFTMSFSVDEKVAKSLLSKMSEDQEPRMSSMLDEAYDLMKQKKLKNPAGFVVREAEKVLGLISDQMPNGK